MNKKTLILICISLFSITLVLAASIPFLFDTTTAISISKERKTALDNIGITGMIPVYDDNGTQVGTELAPKPKVVEYKCSDNGKRCFHLLGNNLHKMHWKKVDIKKCNGWEQVCNEYEQLCSETEQVCIEYYINETNGTQTCISYEEHCISYEDGDCILYGNGDCNSWIDKTDEEVYAELDESIQSELETIADTYIERHAEVKPVRYGEREIEIN